MVTKLIKGLSTYIFLGVLLLSNVGTWIIAKQDTLEIKSTTGGIYGFQQTSTGRMQLYGVIPIDHLNYVVNPIVEDEVQKPTQREAALRITKK